MHGSAHAKRLPEGLVQVGISESGPSRWRATTSSMAEASELLKHRRLGNHRLRLALLVGRALACSDLVEGAPLCLHLDMGVTREHGARDVPGDAHDHLVARARFRELRD